MPKNVVIFSDGTGQAGGFRFDEDRSNVYKLYRACRCGPDSSVDPAEQVTFYDPGLGSQADGGHLAGRLLRWAYNLVSQATGFGITANVVDCYAALIRLWRPGDRIYLVGFSRGAYTVRCLAGVLGLCGVPTTGAGGAPLPLDVAGSRRLASLAVKQVYQFTASRPEGKATPRQQFLLDTRSLMAERFRLNFGSLPAAGALPDAPHEAPTDAGDVNAYPYFVGVFDTVAALGSPTKTFALLIAYLVLAALASLALSYLTLLPEAPLFGPLFSWLSFRNTFATIVGLTVAALACAYLRTHVKFDFGVPGYGFNEGLRTLHLTQMWQKFYDTNLNPNIAYAKHALSIDEERKAFDRVPWGQRRNKRSPNDAAGTPRFEQVWFAGNHSDIGGSYPENDSRLSDIALAWMLAKASAVPCGLRHDPRLLALWPDPGGPQHDEVRAGLGLLTKLTGITWARRARSLPAPNATMHRTVYERFDRDEVVLADRRGPYRPAFLAGHDDFARYYGPEAPARAHSLSHATALAVPNAPPARPQPAGA